MALLRYNEVSKLSVKERETKLKELKAELVKANVVANRQTAKTKEIKKAIARILTFGKNAKKEVKKN